MKNIISNRLATTGFNPIAICTRSALMIIAFTLILGIVYPLTVTGLAQYLFPYQANGSLITKNNKVIGSEMIGQDFRKGAYFQSRPSATSPNPYNAASSSGSNLGATNPKLKEVVSERVQSWRMKKGNNLSVPSDLVTASSSGLDPNITEEAARYQASVVAKLRKLPEQTIQALITMHVQKGLTGATPYVNVLQLNMALDELTESTNK